MELNETSLPDLTLRRLVFFDALVQSGSYAAAAEQLSVPTATLWRQIKQLEEDLQVTLVTPGPRGTPTRLTPEGEVIHHRVLDVLRSSKALFHLAGTAGLRADRPLRVGGYPAHTAVCLAQLWTNLASEGIEVSLGRSSDTDRTNGGERLVEDLSRGLFDLVIAPPRGSIDSERIEFEYLYSWQLVAVVDDYAPLRSQGVLPVAELSDVQLLVSPERHESRRLLSELADKAFTNLTVLHENDSVETLLALGRAGLGVPVLPADALASYPSVSHIRPLVTPDGATATDSFYLYYRTEDRELPALQRALAEAKRIMVERRSPGITITSGM